MLLERPRLACKSAELEHRRPRTLDGASCLPKRSDRLRVLMRLGERLGTRKQRLDLRPLLRRDTDGEEDGIDSEAFGEPGDRVLGRTRLPALDLADVLLGDATRGKLRLGQPRGHAQRAHTLAEACATTRR